MSQALVTRWGLQGGQSFEQPQHFSPTLPAFTFQRLTTPLTVPWLSSLLFNSTWLIKKERHKPSFLLSRGHSPKPTVTPFSHANIIYTNQGATIKETHINKYSFINCFYAWQQNQGQKNSLFFSLINGWVSPEMTTMWQCNKQKTEAGKERVLVRIAWVLLILQRIGHGAKGSS